jgi:hypothetical protein
MGTWLLKLAVLVATTAIARGIVAAFGLDAKVSRFIQMIGAYPNLQAVAWTLSGLIGLLAVVAWSGFNVSEKIAGGFSSDRPALGSLNYVNLIPGIERKQNGVTHAQLSVELNNGNDFLLKYRATLHSQVNGKADTPITFEGLIPAHQSRYAMANPIQNVPVDVAVSPFLSGRLDYDITYFAAPSGRATRRTARRVYFSTEQGRDIRPVGTQEQHRIITRFENEIEE